ncbi:UDP-N-acetylglucosamine 2-epimerase (non-hydrolysing) [Melghiribacillus thermohalophilus]|uniref:UDP-N-acetylglucosamine 2-epimerase (Non-hydrolysing) n=1 Tax=Melghiribacillus thermohalophilus TaxID=1324956 RepID=A0A4R3N8U3_9BACI|nr:UDP-N-acetylglucosamine 2-epimerase (non-hydrolyzing) [Melghiribacillus thermohalophilus]TCT25017.1 UDP-N-acetylglucosamine 2-epimerase (non-hydrolysing) [Melghiribacillus thermohalophilus]
MKIMTILGTRPEIIRLSLIMPLLDQYAKQHVIVHTGQNFTRSLNDVFFAQLGLRTPDYVLSHSQKSFGEQLSIIFTELETILSQEEPDRVLILGDTNSALSAILAERMNIPVIHMEAGNRCFDREVPEEINRKMVDSVSSFNLPYTERSKQHLIQEGIPVNRIYVTGNPIYEVIQHYDEDISKSNILERLKVDPYQYFLVTFHRSENVDCPEHLNEIIQGLNLVGIHYGRRIICSIHPRTRSKISKELLDELHPLVEFYEPFGFFEFIHLLQHAACVLTDSGTVQEECCISHVPAVTLRKTTERPETIECGSNVLSGLDARSILEKTDVMLKCQRNWNCPEGYLDRNVSDRVVKFLLGGAAIV